MSNLGLADRPSEDSRLTIVVCAEDNDTGPAAALLVASLRRLPGPWADADVLCFSPRARRTVSPKVRQALQALNVEFVGETLNDRWIDLPHSNKVLAAAWAERRAGGRGIIAVLDSDSIFTSDPETGLGIEAPAVSPVWLAGFGE